MRGWTWRTRYSTYLGGLGTGIGEGNEGVECGKGELCLAAREVEKEIDCDSEELENIRRDFERFGGQGRPWDGSGYMAQEIEGIGGVVKKKVKKRIKVGAVVKEYEDEREDGDYLNREQRGLNRSWCFWCLRVLPSIKDKKEPIDELSRALTSESSSSSVNINEMSDALKDANQKLETIQKSHDAAEVKADIQQSDNVAHALSGAGGGMLAMALTYPLITLSTRSQVESKRAKSSVFEASRRIVEREGIAGLFSGVESALFGISATNFVYYYWYEWTRAFFERAALRAGRATRKLTTVESMMAGALAGSATVLITNPIWVINTRLTARKEETAEKGLPGGFNEAPRQQRPSTLGTLFKMLKEEGPLSLFAGVMPALVLVLNPILQYTIFEQLKNLLEKRRKVGPTDSFYLGAIGKLFATSITYPYLTVKSRAHVAGKEGPKDNLFASFNKILREEGWSGLYGGIGPKVTQSVITAAFLFGFKDILYEAISKSRRTLASRLLPSSMSGPRHRGARAAFIDLTFSDDEDVGNTQDKISGAAQSEDVEQLRAETLQSWHARKKPEVSPLEEFKRSRFDASRRKENEQWKTARFGTTASNGRKVSHTSDSSVQRRSTGPTPVPRNDSQPAETGRRGSQHLSTVSRSPQPNGTNHAKTQAPQDLCHVPFAPGLSKRYVLAPGTLACPLSRCPYSKKDFGLTWRVTEHMKRDHGWPRSAKSASQNGQASFLDEKQAFQEVAGQKTSEPHAPKSQLPSAHGSLSKDGQEPIGIEKSSSPSPSHSSDDSSPSNLDGTSEPSVARAGFKRSHNGTVKPGQLAKGTIPSKKPVPLSRQTTPLLESVKDSTRVSAANVSIKHPDDVSRSTKLPPPPPHLRNWSFAHTPKPLPESKTRPSELNDQERNPFQIDVLKTGTLEPNKSNDLSEPKPPGAHRSSDHSKGPSEPESPSARGSFDRPKVRSKQDQKGSQVREAAKKPFIELPENAMEDTERIILAGRDRTGLEGDNRWTAAEDAAVKHLKEDLGIGFPAMFRYFPHRPTAATLATRYSTKIKDRTKPRLKETDRELPVIDASHNLERRNRRPGRPRRDDYAEPPVEFTPDFEAGDAYEASGLYQAPRKETIEHRGRRGRPPRVRTDPQEVIPATSFEATAPLTQLSLRPKPQDWENDEHLVEEIKRDQAGRASLLTLLVRSPTRETSSPRVPRHMSHRPLKKKMMKKRSSLTFERPYLRIDEREFLAESLQEGSLWDEGETQRWKGEVLHVDFTEEEYEVVEAAIHSVISSYPLDDSLCRSKRIVALMQNANDEQILRIASRVIWRGGYIHRTLDSIKSLLYDARLSQISSVSATHRLGYRSTIPSMSSLLRHREVGQFTRHAPTRRPTGITRDMKTRGYDTLGPSKMFKATSSDVNAVAWSPQGNLFAVGSFALTDESSMQYNRPNNLLLGNFYTSELYELPDHAVKRHAERGVNATAEMQASQDPYLFSTISSVQFSPDGKVLFSAGYDGCVRLWNMCEREEERRCTYRVPLGAEVDLLATSTNGMFAVARQSCKEPVRVYRYLYDDGLDDITGFVDGSPIKLGSENAQSLHQCHIIPSCLRWGSDMAIRERYLLGGFAAKDDELRRGEICLWDVEAGSKIGMSINKRQVFDVAWSPTIFGRFAVGSSPSSTCNRGTQSMISIHDSRFLPSENHLRTNPHKTLELECPALDINDVVFSSHDENILSTGCTDGTVYLWDLRRPDYILHRCRHDAPLVELDDSRPRECSDTGVRFLTWGESSRNLYSGSSDGIVASWNPYLAPEDAFQRDVVRLNSGVMAGAFSPDYTNLLLGDVQGTVLMLSVGNEDKNLQRDNGCESFVSIPASEKKREEMRKKFTEPPSPSAAPSTTNTPKHSRTIGNPNTTSTSKPASARPNSSSDDPNVHPSKALLTSGAITLRPLGDFPILQAVQGPNYNGPYDNAPDAPIYQSLAASFQHKARLVAEKQSDSDRRRARERFLKEREMLVTGEEGVWDDGSSKDRLPEVVRGRVMVDAADKGGEDARVEGLKCFRCGKESLYRDVDGLFAAPLNPNFSSPKSTTARNDANDSEETLTCYDCRCAFRPETLGYTTLSAGTASSSSNQGIDLGKPCIPFTSTFTKQSQQHMTDKQLADTLALYKDPRTESRTRAEALRRLTKEIEGRDRRLEVLEGVEGWEFAG
ncbi:MAG: hypothetical protein M1831_003156 [Alyxoria varia]|nr:MAG: hypothetical protein M1831_003156 [Alyxoria varia]